MTTLPEEISVPVVQLPGSTTIPSIAPAYVDGIPVELAAPPSSPANRTARENRFWSSQPRPATSTLQENYFISISKPKTINYLSFDLAHFPQQVTISWMDTDGSWQPVTWQNGNPLTVVVSGSVPAVVNNAAALAAGMNPYHYGAGHWMHFDEAIQAFTTTQLLFTFTRNAGVLPSTALPVDASGVACPYPVGLRDLDFGYRILQRSDVPATGRSATVVTERQPFDVTSDVHGSPMIVAIRENRVSDLLNGLPWKSEPQLRADAVVNLYADSRSPSGQPQVIDGFYIDPVTSGVRLNLYYSPSGPPPGITFPGPDTPLVFPSLNAGGPSLPQPGSQGLLFPSAGGWVTVSAQAAGLSSGTPWWAAIAIQPQFASTDPGSYLIADTGLFQLYFSGGSFTLQAGSGAVIAQWSPAFSASTLLVFAVAFDGISISGWMQGQSLASLPAASLPAVSAISLGAPLPATPGMPSSGNFLLTAMIVKQEQLPLGELPEILAEFAADPQAFTAPAAAGGTIENAAMVFSPALILGQVNPWGFSGGITSSYESCSWIPVSRNYKLSRGFLEFDPVLAAVFKFEFTSLRPEPFDYIQPLPKKVKTLPGGLNPGGPNKPAVVDTGLQVTSNLAPSINYADTPPIPLPPASNAALPREALHATDPAGADALAQLGTLYSFQPWQPAATVPMQAAAGTHAYGEAILPARQRIGYFVSLSKLTMYRSSFASQDDTEQYVETFGDQANLSPLPAPSPAVPWNWAPGFLTTPAGLGTYAQVQSQVFPSDHKVTGVQFATTQSDPVQLLPDPAFAMPGVPSWGPAGDADPVTIATGINTALGGMARVTRNPAAYTWAELSTLYVSWAQLAAGIGAWAAFGNAAPGSTLGGLVCTQPQAVTGAGRVYAAVRVFATQGLTQPLALQLLDGATGTVLSETDNPVAGGVVTEWFTGYTLGSASTTSALSWVQVQNEVITWNGTAGDTWSQLDLSVQPLGQTITAQVIQRGVTQDTWYVDNLSVFEDSVTWSFSNDGGASWYAAYDIRNNPSGVMKFPPPQQGTGNQLRWQLQGWRPGLTVSSLVLRPWYSLHPKGIAARTAGIGYGPNLTPLDHYAPVARDPRWQMWDQPIPQSWYFAYQQLLLQEGAYVPVPEFPGIVNPPVLGNALAVTAASQVPPAPLPEPAWDDVFTDVFTDTYGIAPAGDVYDDNYDDVYASDYIITTGTVWQAGAALSQGSVMSVTAADVPLVRPLAGAALGLVPGTGTAVTSFLAVTGEPLGLRRVYLGNQIPATLAGSLVSYDAGVRKVFIDFQPDATTTPLQLSAFLASCQAGGLQAEISLWANPDTAFTSPQDYLTIVSSYLPAIRQNGYDHIFVISNASAVHRNGFGKWYPGDSSVDGISVGFYCQGASPGDIVNPGGPVIGSPFIPVAPAGPYADTLVTAAQFADLHGQPLGLAEFGADWSLFTNAQGAEFLSYVLSFLKARIGAGKPVGDCSYLSASTYTLQNAPAAWVSLYKQIAALLASAP